MRNDTLAVFVSFLASSFSSVIDFACFLTFIADCDLLTDGSVDVGRRSPVAAGFALSALSDLTRVRDSLLTAAVARLGSLVVPDVADGVLVVIKVRVDLSADAGTADVAVSDERLRPVLV